MMQRKYSHSSSAVLLVLMLVFPAGEASAQRWFESYREGLDALQQGRNAEAVSCFSRAITERPDSKAAARTYGVNFIDYFPYVYRGIAHARLGERSVALNDFEKEHAAGEVYNGQRDTKAGSLLRERLTEFRSSTPARKSQPEPLHGDEPDSLFTVAVHDLQEGNITKAKALFLEVRKRRASYAGLDEQFSRIRGFEQDVRKGIAAFLNGKYEQAVQLLTPLAERGRDHANTQAFLGCSHAALYLLSGGDNQDAREKAFGAFRRVKRIDASFDLNRPFVSPTIRDLFSAVPAESQTRRKDP
jgi:tetratricopeptide (TPR) repeat protein